MTCDRLRAISDAFVQRSENFSPSETILRSLMPVRVVIHSSDVSTSFSRSALERTFFGTAAPVPTTRARFIPYPRRQALTREASREWSSAIDDWIFCASFWRENSAANRIAFLIAFALERPWQMITQPWTPSIGAPPYSE